MAKKPLWRRLKYKNIAIALAALLIIILIITSACSAKNKDKSDDSGKTPAVTNSAKEDKNDSKPDDSASDPKPENPEPSNEKLENNYKYVSISNDENLYSGDLILINGDYAYKGGEPTDLVSSIDYRHNAEGSKVMSIKDSNVTAKKKVLESLNRMLSDFRAEKNINDVMLVSGYRTVEYQQKLYEENLASTGLSYSKTVEIPEHSEHHSGYAVDFQLDQENYPRFTGEGEYGWIDENCYKYGFILRYLEDKSDITGIDPESWHYRYVGVPHAQLIYENGICFEEYINSIKQYTREAPLYFNDFSNTRYAIYYVKASDGDSTNVDIPLHKNETGYQCAISGNNCDGYIVTVNISAGEVTE